MNDNKLNRSCAQLIDQEIKDSNYELYRYNLDGAAKTVIAEYGSERVQFVLASILKNQGYDGRYSQTHKEWAKGFDIPDDNQLFVITHPAVMDGFIIKARTVIAELEKNKTIAFDNVQSYEIKRAVLFENDRGFALAESKIAPSKFVTWQYTEENGARDFYWGHYVNSKDSAQKDYAERVGDYKTEYGFKEKYNFLATVEMNTEQNHNMIDGLQNNLATPRADLTDGQTLDEIKELAPETLPSDVRELVSLLRYCSNNLNQYAKRANETGSIYTTDIEDLQKRLDDIWNDTRGILHSLSNIQP